MLANDIKNPRDRLRHMLDDVSDYPVGSIETFRKFSISSPYLPANHDVNRLCRLRGIVKKKHD
jgi:hypothetical protein